LRGMRLDPARLDRRLCRNRVVRRRRVARRRVGIAAGLVEVTVGSTGQRARAAEVLTGEAAEVSAVAVLAAFLRSVSTDVRAPMEIEPARPRAGESSAATAQARAALVVQVPAVALLA